MAAAAGARRTDTAYERFLRDSNASDAYVAPYAFVGDLTDRIRTVSGVQVEGRFQAATVGEQGPDGSLLSNDSPDEGLTVYVDLDDSLGRTDRPRLLGGRLPDRDRADEVLINRTLARRRHLRVGDRLELLNIDRSLVARYRGDEDLVNRAVRRGDAHPEVVTFTVTGIGLFSDEVGLDTRYGEGVVIVPRIYLTVHQPVLEWVKDRVRVDPGTSPQSVRVAIDQAVAPDRADISLVAERAHRVGRTTRPYVVGLALVAVVLGLAGAVVVGQMLRRQSMSDALDDPLLLTLGVTIRQLATLRAARAAVVAVVGVAVAVMVALACSLALPLGPASDADPNQGLAVDGPVIALGAAAIVVLAESSAIRVGRGAVRAGRPGSSAGRTRARPAPPPASSPIVLAALRGATGGGRVATRTVRVALVSSVVAVAAIVAVLTCSATLDRVAATPARYGWNWDVMLIGGGGYSTTRDAPSRSRGIRAWPSGATPRSPRW